MSNSRISELLPIFHKMYGKKEYKALLDKVGVILKKEHKAKDIQKTLRHMGHPCFDHCRNELDMMLAAALLQEYLRGKKVPHPTELAQDIYNRVRMAQDHTRMKQQEQQIRKQHKHSGQSGNGQGQQGFVPMDIQGQSYGGGGQWPFQRPVPPVMVARAPISLHHGKKSSKQSMRY